MVVISTGAWRNGEIYCYRFLDFVHFARKDDYCLNFSKDINY